MRLLLPDTMRQQRCLLRQPGDGRHHRHELLPRGQVPLRPQRHGLRRHGQARPERQAPPRRHHRHPVQESALRVPWPEGDLPRRAGLEPGVLRGAGRVRGRRWRRGASGPQGGQLRIVDADARVVGIHLAPRLRPPPPGSLLHAHHQRVRQDAGGRQDHPGQLGSQRLLPLHRPVQLKKLHAELIIWNHWLDLVLYRGLFCMGTEEVSD